MPDISSPNNEFTRVREAYGAEHCPNWEMRKQRLRTLEKLLLENRDAIAEAIDADFGGRPPEETALLELFPSLSAIRHTLKHGRRWMRTRRRFAEFWFLPARTELLPQPLGIIGIIVPWNYPLYLSIGPLTDAIAAGNGCLLKLSEFTPHFATVFSELLKLYFPGNEVRAVTGDAEVGKAFSALPFDHLLFTGSTGVGRQVMRAAAANLTPVTLELGGKSPAIIGPDARFEHAVKRILVGKCFNAGQTCIAPDYVLLPRTHVQEFIETARQQFTRLYPKFASNRQYAGIIDDAHHARLQRLYETAIAAGANPHSLGDSPGTGRRLAPTLFSDVATDSPLMQEEIFGPWLPLIPYDDFDEALTFIATRPHPLALYLFDDNQARLRRTLERTRAGGVTINDTLCHITQSHLPFGGVGPSGMGSYHGETGFRTFSRMTPVFRQSRLSGFPLLSPPYGARFRYMLRWLLGRAR
ncbi:MAG: coniferyl aldehyde dehydrogenase [Gammaproteobacteria bacterium]